MPLDIEDQSSIERLITDISTSYQRVDALYNVAGILGDGKTTPGPERAIEKIERDWLEKTFAVNVFGPTMLAKGLSPMMRSKGRTKVKVATLEGPVDVELPKKVRECLTPAILRLFFISPTHLITLSQESRDGNRQPQRESREHQR